MLTETNSAVALYSTASFNFVSLPLSRCPLSQSIASTSHPYLVMPKRSRDDVDDTNVLPDRTRPVANRTQSEKQKANGANGEVCCNMVLLLTELFCR